MILNDIMTISGKGGLYRVVAETKKHFIVESFVDKKRFAVSNDGMESRLDTVEIYTQNEDKDEDENILLPTVMDAIYAKESGGPCIDAKAPDEQIMAYFEEIVPNYNRKTVYISNMRKLFTWYNFLHQYNMLRPDETTADENKESETKDEQKAADNVAKEE